MAPRAHLAGPDHDPGQSEEEHECSADACEREPATQAIDDPDDAIRVVPPRDVPHDQPAEQDRNPDERIAEGASRHELFVDGGTLLAEESIRAEGGGHTGEPVEGEGAAAVEMRDEDVLDTALAVHELDQLDVFGLEPHVEPRAALATWILQNEVHGAVAPAKLGALDVRNEP